MFMALLPPLTLYYPLKLLSTGNRTWLTLDIPVLRKPHLIRSWGCEEADRAAKALKNRPVN